MAPVCCAKTAVETKSKRRQQVSLLCIESPLLLKTVGTAVGAILHPRFTRLGQEKSLFLAQRPFELSEEPFVLAPPLVHGDVKVEIDLRAEDRFELFARLGADAFHHRAL